MNPCVACGALFTRNGKNYRCLPCRRKYHAEWRKRRAAAGLRAGGSKTWDPQKKAAWSAKYYSDPAVKARLADVMRKSQSRHPDRVRARRLLRSEIEKGRMTRKPCEVCGAEKTHAHHWDYSKPLDVKWLCRTHHDQVHHENAKAEGRSNG